MLGLIGAAIWILLAYLCAGLAFAVAFVSVGVARVDGAAEKTGPLFRLLIVPGVAAFWPLMAVRWVKTMKAGSP